MFFRWDLHDGLIHLTVAWEPSFTRIIDPGHFQLQQCKNISINPLINLFMGEKTRRISKYDQKGQVKTLHEGYEFQPENTTKTLSVDDEMLFYGILLVIVGFSTIMFATHAM